MQSKNEIIIGQSFGENGYDTRFQNCQVGNGVRKTVKHSHPLPIFFSKHIADHFLKDTLLVPKLKMGLS